MKKLKRSLLRRLIIGQLLAVITFSLLAMGNVVWQFSRQGEGEYDQQLTGAAKAMLATVEKKKDNPAAIRSTIAIMDEVIRSNIAYENERQTHGQGKLDIVLRVVDKTGEEIYRTPGYSEIPFAAINLGSTQFTTGERHWRAHTAEAEDKSLKFQLAQTTEALDAGLTGIIVQYIVIPLLIFLPFAALMAWLTTSRGLSPLRELTGMIARRNPHDLKPLEHVATYAETLPLVNEINTLLHKLDTTVTRERNFLADAAHELRTPLAVIQAQAHVLRQAKNDTEKNLAAAELNSGVGRAASLIQKLLLTARVSVADFVPRFEPIDLTAFVQERVATFSLLAAEKKIDMELLAPPHCMVKIDRETFVSAVDNILDNAIRYTPEGGSIAIDVTPLANGTVSLRIADNGAGIAHELYERVFERFYRVAGSEQQGSGLGLAIVKRVIALHGGNIALSTGLQQRGLAVNLTVPVIT